MASVLMMVVFPLELRWRCFQWFRADSIFSISGFHIMFGLRFLPIVVPMYWMGELIGSSLKL